MITLMMQWKNQTETQLTLVFLHQEERGVLLSVRSLGKEGIVEHIDRCTELTGIWRKNFP